MTRYFKELERLAADLMQIFAVGLELPANYFADKIDKQCGSLRALWYPEQPEAPFPGQLRAGAHTDYGSLTILKTEDAPGGLQVRRRDGEWINVDPVPGCFIINIGDLMMHWTNDRWVSTLHRVVNPPRDYALGSCRLSLAFFHQPNYDAEIRCLDTCQGPGNPAKYPPTTSGAHRLYKLNRANDYEPVGVS
jgi:isopenicillin N synthase-like dioxygenase